MNKYKPGDTVIHCIGSCYTVLCYATNEIDHLPVVVYQSTITNVVWLRSKEEFEQEDRFKLF